jgi:hypothetical protein
MHEEQKRVYPRCKAPGAQIYVTAEGIVTRCCWIGSGHIWESFKKFYGDDLSKIDLNNSTLDEIMAGEAIKKIEHSWSTKAPFSSCLNYCSKPRDFAAPDFKGTNSQARVRL